MKIEKYINIYCEKIKKEVEIKILVHLAERWCGYNIINLSECPGKKSCGTSNCEFISVEEEKAADQLIADYFEQLDLRAQIREKEKHSNL